MSQRIAFTIGTLVTDHRMYDAMRASFEAGGFKGDVEWLSIDNSKGTNQMDAYAGLNSVLSAAQGRYVILCHQDVLLLSDDRAVLERRLEQLETDHPDWAVAGNAGGVVARRIVRRITDMHGEDQAVGQFPHRVVSLDENFLVVKRNTRVGFSADLSGFHFYGTDICLIADILGYSCWVIDFHLKHLGRGAMGEPFARSEQAFRAKWTRALRTRKLQTTCTYVTVSGRQRPAGVVRAQEVFDLRLGRLRRSLEKRGRKDRQT